jgi:ABC-type antimicrobial peptide transport system permease subunit
MDAPGIRYEIPGRVYAETTDKEFCRFQFVSENFLSTMDMKVQRGQGFNPEDFIGDYPRKVIVNKAFAEREWPLENPIGKQFQPDFMIEGTEFETIPMVEVVGLIESMQESGIFIKDKDDGAAFIAPQVTPAMPRFITILVKPSMRNDLVIPIIREELMKLDSNLPIYMTGTPKELNDRAMVQFNFFISIFKQFGILATFLAAVGIYGVITFSVNQRIMEFGIRQALGATQKAVFKLVFTHALKQLSMGFLFALLLLSPIILLDNIKDSMVLFFYEIDPNSLVPYMFSFGFVALIAIAAATPPALKAARIQPAQALRHE